MIMVRGGFAPHKVISLLIPALKGRAIVRGPLRGPKCGAGETPNAAYFFNDLYREAVESRSPGLAALFAAYPGEVRFLCLP
jgi:hypothetical protein